jgi:putative Mg2+ transporter-C (MgtC) family protein
MDEFLTAFSTKTYTSFPVIAARLLLAAALGAAIGFEREWQQRPAGLRTHMLVCVAGALITILTIEITHVPFFQDNAVQVDPIRLIEAVTAGVAFLAAGVIILSKGEVHGLTTGAGMWVAASVGLACGLGFWQIALLACILVIIVLAIMQQVLPMISADKPKIRDAKKP